MDETDLGDFKDLPQIESLMKSKNHLPPFFYQRKYY